jgi:hypothetical protein
MTATSNSSSFDPDGIEIEDFLPLPIFPASPRTPIHQKSKVGRQ